MISIGKKETFQIPLGRATWIFPRINSPIEGIRIAYLPQPAGLPPHSHDSRERMT